ncbi:glycosyltransferase [Psychroserpens sp. AS72]|uniref:glycosyltransferase family 2 protein n=1 Tax=Psychroserpens sp. AS72 TaxID=3135775 RepID=UPI00317DA4E5
MNNQSAPLISVSVVTYNHVNYIKQCLEGILMQKTTFPFEIILGEDESTDGTRAICEEYAERFPNIIRLFLRSRKDVIKINGNATGRFNFMENLKACQGKYIATCEGDDYWIDPLKLQKQVDLLESDKDMIACHHWQKIAVEENGIFIEKLSPKDGYHPQSISTVQDIFNNKMRVKMRTLMFKNIIDINFIPDWFSQVAFGDVPISMLLGKHGYFGFIDEKMAVYRQTKKGVSTSGLKELGRKKFNEQHFKNWIQIWDLGNIEYNYQYQSEVDKTIEEFYIRILKLTSVSLKTYIRLISYNIFERKVGFLKTYKQTLLITYAFIKTFFKKAKNKVQKMLEI